MQAWCNCPALSLPDGLCANSTRPGYRIGMHCIHSNDASQKVQTYKNGASLPSLALVRAVRLM
jgi:hypothetical protein